jgi:hypothetical protein
MVGCWRNVSTANEGPIKVTKPLFLLPNIFLIVFDQMSLVIGSKPFETLIKYAL